MLCRQPRRLLRLLVCQIFMLNLLAAAVIDADAAAASPFEAMLQGARCGEAAAPAGATWKADAAPDQDARDQAPAGRRPDGSHSCPLCATACPMGGCAPVDAGPAPLAAAPAPGDFPGIGSFLHLVSVKRARLLSDAAAQAPPAAPGSRVHVISVQS